MNTEHLCIHPDTMAPVITLLDMPSYKKMLELSDQLAEYATRPDAYEYAAEVHDIGLKIAEYNMQAKEEFKNHQIEESLNSGDLTILTENFSKDQKVRIMKDAAANFLRKMYEDSFRQTLIENEQSNAELEKLRTINHFDEVGMACKFWVTFNPVMPSYERLRDIMHETFTSWDLIENVRFVLETRTDTKDADKAGGFHTHFLVKTSRELYKSTFHQRLYQKWNRYCGSKKHIVVSAYSSSSFEKSKITYMLKHPKHEDDWFIYPEKKELEIIQNL